MQFCFLVPVYNHPHYLEKLVAYLADFKHPIVLINDGSVDVCRALMMNLAAQYPLVTVLHHEVNQGKGQAVMTGLLHAQQQGYSHALQIDADGQHHWQDVAKFLALAEQSPQHMIIGNPIFDASVPKKRLYGRYATHIWVWINSLSFDIQDSMCGFRVYPVAASCQVITENSLQPRMGFDSEILVRLHWQGVPILNVETPVIYPEDGISHFQVWRDNLGMTKTHTRLFFGMLPRLPMLLKRKVMKS